MARLVFTGPALDDLAAIAAFIGRDSAKYASLFLYKVFERADVLKDHPQIGRIVPETDDETIRELIEGNYRIIYKIRTNKRIEILTVHYSAKLLSGDFDGQKD